MQLCTELLLAIGMQRMFKEGDAEADLGLYVSVCWTCASDCKPAPAPHAHSKQLAGAAPFSPL